MVAGIAAILVAVPALTAAWRSLRHPNLHGIMDQLIALALGCEAVPIEISATTRFAMAPETVIAAHRAVNAPATPSRSIHHGAPR